MLKNLRLIFLAMALLFVWIFFYSSAYAAGHIPCIHECKETPSLMIMWWTCSVIAASGAPLGVLLILRRKALMADALSHGLLPGFSLVQWLASLAGLSLSPLLLGTFGSVFSIVLAIGLPFLSRRCTMSIETLLSGISLVALAFAVYMEEGTSGCHHGFVGFLPQLSKVSLLIMGAISMLSGALMLIFYRRLVWVCFDEDFVRLRGNNPDYYEGMLMGMLVVNLILASQILGGLIPLGFVILPALNACLLPISSIGKTMGVSIVMGMGAIGLALWVQYPHISNSGLLGVLFLGALYALCIGMKSLKRSKKITGIWL